MCWHKDQFNSITSSVSRLTYQIMLPSNHPFFLTLNSGPSPGVMGGSKAATPGMLPPIATYVSFDYSKIFGSIGEVSETI